MKSHVGPYLVYSTKHTCMYFVLVYNSASVLYRLRCLDSSSKTGASEFHLTKHHLLIPQPITSQRLLIYCSYLVFKTRYSLVHI